MERYKLIKEIGRGFFGITFLGVDNKTAKKVAIKVINVKKSTEAGVNISMIHDEIETLKFLASNNDKEGAKYLAKYYDSFTAYLDGEKTVFIVSEYIDGSDLYGYMDLYPQGKIPTNVLWPLFTQLLLGLKYIHDNQYAHRDIKPENILITKSGHIKYIDFGLACLSKCRYDNCQNTCKGKCGTVLYTPPEFYQGAYNINLNTEKAHDIWSLGILMHELTFGKNHFPFDSQVVNKYQIQKNIALAPTFYYRYSGDDGRTLHYLKSILINDYNKRPTIGQAMYLFLDQIMSDIY